MRTTGIALAIAVVAALGGCGQGDEAGIVELVSFQGDSGTHAQQILSAGGLTLDASCNEHSGGPLLAVTARTNADNAFVSAQLDEKHAPPGGYRFVMSDFDRGYGDWDFLGSAPEEATGTLEYRHPDGGHVTVNFIADQGSSQADCIFSGTATVGST